MTPRPSRPDAGFSLPEVMVAMGIMLVVLAGTFTAMTNAMRAEETARSITTLNGHLRSSMDLVVRDLLQTGQGLQLGRVVGIPNGVGAAQIVRPGPAASGLCAGVTPFPLSPTLSAVTAVASTITRATPPAARLPRWTRCQSSAMPSVAEYWHMGDMTMRLRSVTKPRSRGANRCG